MKLTKVFWISIVIMLILFFTPFYLTKDDIAFDGQVKHGFPFNFYTYGGFCMDAESCNFFSIINLILDILIILIIPIILNHIFLKFIKN